VILGTNRDEMKLFAALNPQLVKRRLGLFPVARDPDFYDAAAAYPTQAWQLAAVTNPARAMTTGGHSAVWTYRFDWDEEGRAMLTDLGALIGAGHSIEIPFVFGHFQLLGAYDRFAFTKENLPGRTALSDAMMGYWANFAATGEPGAGAGGQNPVWTRWSNAPSAANAMIFDSPAGGGVRMEAVGGDAAEIFDRLFKDPALKTKTQQCAVYAATVRYNPEFAGPEAARCR